MTLTQENTTQTNHATTQPFTSTPAQREDQAIQLHREFVDIVRTATGMHEPMANTMAAAIVAELRQRWGGKRLGHKYIYIPAPDKSERNAAIRSDFNGTNMAAVSQKYGISRSRLYEIVAERS